MLTLSRGGPIVWMSEVDAAKAGLVDNDWVETFNSNGALVARVVVSQRMKEGTLFMYHAQEKITNMPGSPLTGQRGGIHRSEEHTSELQSLMRISYAVFCFKKKTTHTRNKTQL